MTSARHNIIPLIESYYHTFTPLERTIGDFFIHNTEEQDFSSRTIASQLFVSEASLSRFAQKCGFHGYREFIYEYKQILKPDEEETVSDFDIQEFNTYQELLNKSNALLDNSQITRIVNLLVSMPRVYVYGRGSSGLVAQEMQLRFMRIGMDVNAVTDSHMMKIGAALAGEETLVIAITLSGETAEVLESIRIAKSRGASIICMTAVSGSSVAKESQEVIQVATLKNLDTGTKISPQFSILAIMDVLYSYYFANDSYFKTQKYKATLSAIRAKGEHTEDKDE